MFNLTNKKTLITGGSGGIGKAIAELFIKCESEVIITGTNESKLQAITNELGKNCSYVVCNLNNKEELNNLIANYCNDLDI